MRAFLTILSLTIPALLLAQSNSILYDTVAKPGKFNLSNTKTILRTEVLSLVNTLVTKKVLEVGISGEFCFNRCYSLLLNFNYKNRKDQVINFESYEPGTEIRWYIEMSKQAFMHFGLYSYLEYSNTLIDRRITENKYVQYRESIFENGIASGFRVLLSKRIEADVACYLGLSHRYNVNVIENINSSLNREPGLINARIVLGAGYNF